MDYLIWGVGAWCACGFGVWLWSVLYLGLDMFEKRDLFDLFTFTLLGPCMFAGLKQAKQDMKEIKSLRKVMEGK